MSSSGGLRVRLGARLSGLLIAVLFPLTAAAEAARAWWPLELIVHLRPHLLAGCVLTLLLAALGRRRAVAALALSAAIPHAVALRGLVVGAPARPDGAVVLRLVTANVLTGHGRPADLARWILEQSADVAILLETDESWVEALNEPLADFPYRVLGPRDDNFGVSLYSRRPLEGGRVVQLAGVPAVRARLRVDGALVQLVGVHVPPPLGSAMAARRAEAYAALVPLVAGARRLILAGDFNNTPWSPSFMDLMAALRVRRVGVGAGLLATWPSSLCPAGIPIDHVLIRGDLLVRGHSVGPAFGSDHRPLLTVFGEALEGPPRAAR